MNYKKEIRRIYKAFYKALEITPSSIERSVHELDTEEERMARIRRREMDSTSKRSPKSKETPTTKS
jgi:excinuclease UvrABC helicase subunit UvrB